MSWGQRFRADGARALLAVEAVCVPAWALTGEAMALLAAVVAGAGVVALVLLPDGSLRSQQRRVR